ncbi:restriction endonuclease subunit S [Streptomyces sp. ISL-1]|uniref:restriction endonuclease subunit S n=1 Tax=Streptomyces sp. ISL-1 TaxID=2817657 RepID=UPI001BEC6E45|nr:restriction endonuclease subunit S [Streptomyces sp. ISL-1]MBT2392276.1 restriction endonuclease subunit S [Streptomyces sp. ISL-1]
MTGSANPLHPQVSLRRFINEITDGPFGSSLTSSHYSDDGARVIRLGNIGPAHFKDLDAAYISLEYFRNLRRHEVKSGDLIIAGLGDDNHPVGRACVAPPDLGPSIVKADCFRARLDESRLTHRYAAWALSSSVVSNQVSTLTRGSTRARINLEMAREIKLPVPPVEEQHRIADFLDTETAKVTRLRSRLSRLSTLLEHRQAALLAGCFSAEKDSDSQHSVDSAPLRRVVERWIDYRGATPEKTASGIPLVTAKNIRDGLIDLTASREYIAEDSYDAWMRRGLLKRGDVLLTTEAPLGQVAMVSDPGVALAQRVIVLRVNSEKCSADWLYWYLRSPRAQAELELRATGSTALGIKADRLRGVPIPLVHHEVAEQRLSALGSQVAQCDRLQDKLALQGELLSERLQALIASAVSGKFDVSTASGRGVLSS